MPLLIPPKKTDDAASAPITSSSNLSTAPSDDDNEDAHKTCTRSGCPHKTSLLPIAKFQETNKRDELVNWKSCKDCRSKHAKEDREGKQTKKTKAQARAITDGRNDEKYTGRKRLVVTLCAPPAARRILHAGRRIEARSRQLSLMD